MISNNLLWELEKLLNSEVEYIQRCPCGRCNNFEVVGRNGKNILINERLISQCVPNSFQIKYGERYRIPSGYGTTASYQMEMTGSSNSNYPLPMDYTNYTKQQIFQEGLLGQWNQLQYGINLEQAPYQKPQSKLNKLKLLYWSYFWKNKEKAF